MSARASFVFSAVLISASAVACAHHERLPLEPGAKQVRDQDQDDHGPLVIDHGPPIIFAEQTRVLVKNNAFGGWQVSLADALRADAGAGDFVRAQHPETFAKLARYVAQVFGVTDDNGRKLVEMSFMCNVSLEDDGSNAPAPTSIQQEMSQALLDGPVACNVGGDCCFRLYFDPQSGSYEEAR